MMTLRLLRAEWLKTRRTPLRWAIFAVPVGYAAVLLWYFSLYRTTPELPLKIYNTFFEGWAALLPLIISVLAGVMGLQEEQASKFFVVLGSPAPRQVLYASKLLLLLAVTGGGLLLSVTIMVLGLQVGLGIEGIDIPLFYQGALLTIVGSLSLLAMHLWLSIAFGLGASVGLGGAGFLTAAIIGSTVVGDAIWEVIPWAWPVRLAMHPIAPVSLDRGLLCSILLFVALACLGAGWFHRFEGRQHEE